MTAVADLGRIDGGPLLLFGGPCGNLQATEAMRAEAGRLGIPPARVVCTGDAVAYCADPAETVALIRDWGIHVVMGNCEESLGADADDCGCGFPEGSVCDTAAREWYAHARAGLSAEAKAWMAGLPRRIVLSLGGLRVAVLHGGASVINRYLFASTPEAALDEEIEAAGGDIVVGGHCGLPFSRLVRGRLWHNPGIVGVPANDGTPDGWYGLMTATDQGEVAVGHHRLPYDFRKAAERIREAGLAGGYDRALETGLWPSLDVLPEAERRATGHVLAPAAVTLAAHRQSGL